MRCPGSARRSRPSSTRSSRTQIAAAAVISVDRRRVDVGGGACQGLRACAACSPTVTIRPEGTNEHPQQSRSARSSPRRTRSGSSPPAGASMPASCSATRRAIWPGAWRLASRPRGPRHGCSRAWQQKVQFIKGRPDIPARRTRPRAVGRRMVECRAADRWQDRRHRQRGVSCRRVPQRAARRVRRVVVERPRSAGGRDGDGGPSNARPGRRLIDTRTGRGIIGRSRHGAAWYRCTSAAPAPRLNGRRLPRAARL